MNESALSEEKLTQEFIANLASYAASFFTILNAGIIIALTVLGDVLLVLGSKSASSETLKFVGQFLMIFGIGWAIMSIVKFAGKKKLYIDEIVRKQRAGDEEFLSILEAYIKARRSGAEVTQNRLGINNIEKVVELGETLLEIESLEKAKALLEEEALKASESKDVIEEESDEA